MTREEIIHIFENSRLVSEHFDSEAVTAAYIEGLAALREQEERENPKPLTLDELRKMDAPVWCLCKPIEGGNGFWCLCKKGKIITPSGVCYDVKEIPHWVFLRNKPKEE